MKMEKFENQKEGIEKNIRKYRIQKNLSQYQLAGLVECSQNTISKYERGNVEKLDCCLLYKIARVLEIEFEELTGEVVDV